MRTPTHFIQENFWFSISLLSTSSMAVIAEMARNSIRLQVADARPSPHDLLNFTNGSTLSAMVEQVRKRLVEKDVESLTM